MDKAEPIETIGTFKTVMGSGGLLTKLDWRAPGVRAAAAAALVALATLWAIHGSTAYEALRERLFDLALARIDNPAARAPVVVIDIDRRSLERLGGWPWSREQLASLVSDILAAGPRALALDVLIDGADERSPAALLRRLSEATGADLSRALPHELKDGDATLSSVIRGKPVVLGVALDPDRPGGPKGSAPVLVQGRSELASIWEAAGVSGPPAQVADAASGLGVLSLAGDSDGLIRRVPLVALAGNQLRAGLAIETVRVASQASAYVLARGNVLRLGEISVTVPSDGMMRLMPPQTEVMERRTLSAIDVASLALRTQMQGKIVLLGSSAPELGGLRLASGGTLVPSVQRQTSAVAQVLTGVNPRRPALANSLESLAVILAAFAGWLAAWRGGLATGGLAAAGVAGLWLLVAGALLGGSHLLVDPIATPMAALGSFGLSGLVVALDVRRREAALRRRFEQHLAPELVTRIAQDPSLLKLAGETRVASILFTDVEGFTAMTERSDPPTLIRVLDRYIDEMSEIVVAHGGMVEKIVGDGFHALFNAPLDLPGHADKAVACALAIRTFSAKFANEAEPLSLGFGRTRIGVETGPVIVGDVGGGTRLDYTAYGNAMNTAARLEAANKELGTSICIGPGTAALLSDKSPLRPLGPLAVRGRTAAMNVYDIWPDDMDAEQRGRLVAALGQAGADAAAAATEVARLVQERPQDQALARLRERLG